MIQNTNEWLEGYFAGQKSIMEMTMPILKNLDNGLNRLEQSTDELVETVDRRKRKSIFSLFG